MQIYYNISTSEIIEERVDEWNHSSFKIRLVSSISFQRPDINIDADMYPIQLNPPRSFTGGIETKWKANEEGDRG